ncbi:MAG: ribosome silencing factor [Clostridia bacterium]|nr:ribosome silencing factor [Clostridia bacterium]MBQ3954646.1 ribosome silencing factor [Clostridia bacterium]MBQ5356536.1 ribosome silencing factor [Clostridia bacterium]
MDNETAKLPIEETLTPEQLTNPETFARFVVSILDAKKARDIRLLHVEDRTVIADYFVIATGSSRTQIRALADEIEFKLEPYGIKPHHVEGADTGSWVLEDFGAVIVHLFNTESREFYNLEKLYQDTTEHDISDLITED